MSGDVDEGKWFACIDFTFFNMDTLSWMAIRSQVSWCSMAWYVIGMSSRESPNWQSIFLGNYKHFRSFVRRRRWIRLRRRFVPVEKDQQETHDNEQQLINVDDNDSGFPQSSSSSSSLQVLDNPQHLKEELIKCRLDRERLRILGQVVSKGSASDQLMQQVI